MYPRQLWERELVWLKAIGIRTVEFSIPWNWHQVQPGKYDFTGDTASRRDLARPRSQRARTDWRSELGRHWEIWPLLVFATLGPLVLTNVLWFRSIHKIGANRATLAANLQPFVAAVLAVVLLSESIAPLQLVGGMLIALGLVVVRRRPATAPQPA